MTGQEMLINTLVKVLGIDKTAVAHIMDAAERVRNFDDRLARIERKLDIALGATDVGIEREAGQAGTAGGADAGEGRRNGAAERGAGSNGTGA